MCFMGLPEVGCPNIRLTLGEGERLAGGRLSAAFLARRFAVREHIESRLQEVRRLLTAVIRRDGCRGDDGL